MSGTTNVVDSGHGAGSYGTRDLSQPDLASQPQQPPSIRFEGDSQQSLKYSRNGPATDAAGLPQSNLPIRQEKGRGSTDQDNSRDIVARDRSKQEGLGGKSLSQRTCLKCNQSLTGQFVRAIGGTFHLECFKCRVSVCAIGIVETLLTPHLGLRTSCSIQVFPRGRRRRRRAISTLRDRLLPKIGPTLLCLWRGASRVLCHGFGSKVPHRSFHLFSVSHRLWCER